MDELPSTPVAAAAPAYLLEPFKDLAGWTRFFLQAEVPVLEKTSLALEELRAREEDVDASMLADLVDSDPLFTIKVLAYVSAKRRNTDSTQTETVITSLVMMGVAPFFREFGKQPTVEERLCTQPAALAVLQGLIRRARRAAHFATGFAVHRGDTDVAVIRQAAFLHDFAEMLMCCYAPAMEMEIRAMQQANPTLRTISLQRFVFNIDLNDLRQALMKHWALSELLVRISDGKHPEHPAVRNVLLAVRLARHTESGWDNAALPDDIDDIAVLLNSTARVARAFVYKIDQTA
ncbi:HDOD domain-containing protein [Rhodoferax sp. GW822-FHT02A01]|uniref:HDOD domain-containing protein n=1 Tax=Rhodoferax sp. GW822-FHT02A01 TaxID=3141537 RepID=UPI00315D5B73